MFSKYFLILCTVLGIGSFTASAAASENDKICIPTAAVRAACTDIVLGGRGFGWGGAVPCATALATVDGSNYTLKISLSPLEYCEGGTNKFVAVDPAIHPTLGDLLTPGVMGESIILEKRVIEEIPGVIAGRTEWVLNLGYGEHYVQKDGGYKSVVKLAMDALCNSSAPPLVAGSRFSRFYLTAQLAS